MKMQGVNGAQARITAAVLEWEGMAVQPHRFGGVEYLLGRREIGHIHGDYLVDIPFPTKVSDEIVAAGRASPHHIFPESGWVSFYVRGGGGCGEGDRAAAGVVWDCGEAEGAKERARWRRVEAGGRGAMWTERIDG